MDQSNSQTIATIDGQEFNYCVSGNSGQPIVLLHGLASNLKIWGLVTPHLAQENRVYAFDQRGHGKTFKPEEGYDFDTMCTDLLSFLNHFQITKPILVGHSWGADVVLEFGTHYPEYCKGIVMIDGGTIEPSAREGWTLEIAKSEMAPPPFPGLTETRLKERFARRNDGALASVPEAFESVRGNFYEINGVLKTNLTFENHMRIIEALWNHYPSELYQQINVPCLFLPARTKDASDHPDWYNRKAKFLEKAVTDISTCAVEWFEDSIHDVPLQRPELVATVINKYLKSGFFN
jgi:pimeloyl-ACP methyl ester carboxylesterase